MKLPRQTDLGVGLLQNLVQGLGMRVEGSVCGGCGLGFGVGGWGLGVGGVQFRMGG